MNKTVLGFSGGMVVMLAGLYYLLMRPSVNTIGEIKETLDLALMLLIGFLIFLSVAMLLVKNIKKLASQPN